MKTTKSGAGGSRKRVAPLVTGAAEPAGEPVARAADAPHYQTFTVRFLLDPHRVCRRTEVSHVQRGTSEAWPDYDAARLDSWISAQLGREEAQAEPALPHAEGTRTVMEPGAATLRATARAIELLAAGERTASLAAGAPVTARIELAITGGQDGLQVGYSVATFARRLGGEQVLLCENDGQAMFSDCTIVELPAVAPSPGIYRLSAVVTLATPAAHAEHVTGGLIHIYDPGASGR
jgi:hypothetical protein